LIPALSVRLNDVCREAFSEGRAPRLIDVGSDHGHLACFALSSGLADTAVCTDIHEAPAKRTETCLKQNGFSDRSSTYCTDGLDGVPLQEGDVVVMAGLGGNNMADIMERALAITPKDVLKKVTWCLQPQKSIERLREFFAGEGFVILEEKVSVEKGIWYPILRAVYTGEPYVLSLYGKYYGPVLIRKFEEKDPLTVEYFARLDNRYKLRARGDEEVARLMSERSAST